MHNVQHWLVVGVGVDRRHQPALDAEGVEDHLGRECQAVGRAAGVADDVVLFGVVDALVDPQHDGHVLVGGRRGDDHLASAGLAVRGGLGRVGEDSGRLDDERNAELAPGERRRVLFAEGADLVAVDPDHALARAHLAVESPVGRVVLEEVRVRGGGCEVVDGHHLELVGMTLEHGLEALAADAAESVDPYAGCHRGSSTERIMSGVRR